HREDSARIRPDLSTHGSGCCRSRSVSHRPDHCGAAADRSVASAENEIAVGGGKREEGSAKRGARSEDETTPPRTPELGVLFREDAESYEPRGREVCISISDPEAQPAQVSSRFAAVLRLYFNDITQMGEPTDILFGREHAAAIDEFIDDWPNIDRLVLHCNMGVSR